MKALQIAVNTMTRSFRSGFMLAFMFAIPLLMAGMFALMFGGPSNPAVAPASPASAPAPQVARLAVADLDRGDPSLAQGMAALAPEAAPIESLGAALVGALESEDLSSLLQIIPAGDAEAARQAVRAGQADAALVIPADFSAAYVANGLEAELQPQEQAAMHLYPDPNRPAQVALIESILVPMNDSFAGMKVAMQVAFNLPQIQKAAPDAQTAILGQIAQGYQAAQPMDTSKLVVDVRAPTGAAQKPAANPAGQVVAPILGGMTIFFAFFAGCTVAQGILREGETGTLARLISTPTGVATILGGKFAAVGLTVLVQVSLLLAAGWLVFSIRWGALASVVLAALGIIACAASFGIFAISLLKTTRQAGMVVGGLMTVTGMLGMIGLFGGTDTTPWFALLTPQGWAVRGLQLAMNGAETGEAALNLLVLLALSAAFFAIGRLRFQKRFA